MFRISLYLTLMVVGSINCAITRDSDQGMKSVFRVYDECNKSEEGLVPCLKKKAILFFDRASRMNSIPLFEGVNVIKSSEPNVKPESETEIEAQLPRNLKEKDDMLSEMLLERVASFANSRTIQLSMPRMSTEELGKGVEEGRGKMKKMMGMMTMGFMMKMAAMVPLAIAGLFVLAGKALIVSKIALLLSGIIALKKLLAQKGGGGGGHESHGWSSGGGGGGGSSGGWDRRSLNDVSDVAYSAYKKA